MDKRLRLLVSERQRLGRETATVERLSKVDRDAVETLSDNRQRILTSPIERLNQQGYLTHRDYWAVEQFRATHHGANVSAMPTASMGGTSVRRPPIPAMFRSQRIADARIEWRDLQKAFKRGSLVWITLIASIIDERSIEGIGRDLYGCRDRREARAAGRTGIRVAVSALADHYGL